ncbi:MAG: flagellar protein FlaG [Candidatus Brocadia sp.]|nr:flagellar protein FlaG [Candidatus Brocadia sp.]NUO07159.1 flagellar protein FlaG [Candidatus Brocadia sp.]
MEIHNIHAVNPHKEHNYINKDELVKKNFIPSKTQEDDDQYNETSSPITHYNLGTKVAFLIEKDLHIVVTTVKDSITNKVIRQIPPEETIDRLKLLNNYLNNQR